MSKKFRKLAPVVAAAALVLSGVVTGTSTAHAATIKQGVKCSPVNAKKTVGTVKYTCTTNPLGTPAGNSWTTSDCIAANGAYVTAKQEYDGFVSSQASTLAAIKASIDASTHSIEVLNQQIALTKTKEYIIGYDHTVKPTLAIKVIGIDAAIAKITAHITDITTKRDAAGKQRDASAALLAAKYTATQIAGWAASPVGALSNADVNVQNYANWIRAYSGYDGALASAQKNIAQLQKIPNNFTTKLASAQAQVESMTKRYDQAIANQPSQSATIKGASTQALSVRKSACKAGL
jgi:phage shock protein A